VSGFLIVSLLIITTPGQDTLLTVRNTFGGGFRSGAATAVGVAVGQFCWLAAVTTGSVAVLGTAPMLATAIQIAGATYLVALGSLSMGGALRGHPSQCRLDPPDPRTPVLQGLTSNVANPKMLVFFASFLPQFETAGEPSGYILRGSIFSGMTLAWLIGYAAVVARLGDVLARHGFDRIVEGLAGVVLIGLGLATVSGAFR
jgi:threonine/homoserine/homoserine lactone efflux protein